MDILERFNGILLIYAVAAGDQYRPPARPGSDCHPDPNDTYITRAMTASN